MRIKLLVDINDDYYNVHFKAGQVLPVLLPFNCHGDNKIIVVQGFGNYTYARKGEYEIVKEDKGYTR